MLYKSKVVIVVFHVPLFFRFFLLQTSLSDFGLSIYCTHNLDSLILKFY